MAIYRYRTASGGSAFTPTPTPTPRAATPWGESYDELAEAILADKGAPPVLVLAAFLHKHGASPRLRGLVAAAGALHEAEGGAGPVRAGEGEHD